MHSLCLNEKINYHIQLQITLNEPRFTANERNEWMKWKREINEMMNESCVVAMHHNQLADSA